MERIQQKWRKKNFPGAPIIIMHIAFSLRCPFNNKKTALIEVEMYILKDKILDTKFTWEILKNFGQLNIQKSEHVCLY